MEENIKDIDMNNNFNPPFDQGVLFNIKRVSKRYKSFSLKKKKYNSRSPITK
jgi:hypothetical protein